MITYCYRDLAFALSSKNWSETVPVRASHLFPEWYVQEHWHLPPCGCGFSTPSEIFEFIPTVSMSTITCNYNRLNWLSVHRLDEVPDCIIRLHFSEEANGPETYVLSRIIPYPLSIHIDEYEIELDEVTMLFEICGRLVLSNYALAHTVPERRDHAQEGSDIEGMASCWIMPCTDYESQEQWRYYRFALQRLTTGYGPRGLSLLHLLTLGPHRELQIQIFHPTSGGPESVSDICVPVAMAMYSPSQQPELFSGGRCTEYRADMRDLSSEVPLGAEVSVIFSLHYRNRYPRFQARSVDPYIYAEFHVLRRSGHSA